jgi:hypothetical protein
VTQRTPPGLKERHGGGLVASDNGPTWGTGNFFDYSILVDLCCVVPDPGESAAVIVCFFYLCVVNRPVNFFSGDLKLELSGTARPGQSFPNQI